MLPTHDQTTSKPQHGENVVNYHHYPQNNIQVYLKLYNISSVQGKSQLKFLRFASK
jgi:hypothetical protein